MPSDFSSWGVPGNLDLKPEITAPGGNIWSTLTDGTYGSMSGTSMSAPSVTGMAAVVAQYLRETGLAEPGGHDGPRPVAGTAHVHVQPAEAG